MTLPLQQIGQALVLNDAASDTSIESLEHTLGCTLPSDYKDFLKFTNGAEGWIGDEYFILWPIEEVMRLNNAYRVETFAPGLLLIGSNGGGEAFAFDMRYRPAPIVKVPFVGMDLSLVILLAESFEACLMSWLVQPTSPAEPQQHRPTNRERLDKELFDIKPIILGGDPTDPTNKMVLTRSQHIEYVNYWNNLIRDLRTKHST